jgi:hypothetical protein
MFPAVALLFLAATDGTGPPPQLACLARYYRVEPIQRDGAWFGKLPDGKQIPFDDGQSKTFEERLASPDLKDIFVVPYQPGPIVAVEEAEHDPGRFRVEALLRASFGDRPAAEQTQARFLGMPVRVHKKIAPALARVEARLTMAREGDATLRPFLHRLSGGFVDRNIAGTARKSAHAFGIALDLDKSKSDYWRWQIRGPHRWRNRIPQAIVDAFEAEGFIWGGRWYHYDTMHFEYRPELLDPSCWP